MVHIVNAGRPGPGRARQLRPAQATLASVVPGLALVLDGSANTTITSTPPPEGSAMADVAEAPSGRTGPVPFHVVGPPASGGTGLIMP